MTEAYPLRWPDGWPRTPAAKRRKATFTTQGKPVTVSIATRRVHQQVGLLRGRYLVISSNMELRRDGFPRSDGRMASSDIGAAVYFQLQGKPTAMPCDAFNTLADNIAAIAAHIDAVRRIERYGVGTVEQMFSGFQAIRGPGMKPWREVLGIKPDALVSLESVRARLRELARLHHPDSGGDGAYMAEINEAADRAQQELQQQ